MEPVHSLHQSLECVETVTNREHKFVSKKLMHEVGIGEPCHAFWSSFLARCYWFRCFQRCFRSISIHLQVEGMMGGLEAEAREWRKDQDAAV